jgi:hypothetical protein
MYEKDEKNLSLKNEANNDISKTVSNGTDFGPHEFKINLNFSNLDN